MTKQKRIAVIIITLLVGTIVILLLAQGNNTTDITSTPVIIKSHHCPVCNKIHSVDTLGSLDSGREIRNEIGEIRIHNECKEKYSDILFKKYQDGLKKKDYYPALISLKESGKYGNKNYSNLISNLDRIIKDKEAKESAKEKEKELQAGAKDRKDYSRTLRTHFLDNNMDIEVSVSGSHNKDLRLRYVLISAVWVHNFEKSELFKEISWQGYEKIVYDDKYTATWTTKFK